MSKVYYYTIKLRDVRSGTVCNLSKVKEKLISIIDGENSKCVEAEGREWKAIDLTRENQVFHFIADVFDYKDEYLFLRLSSQKPTGDYLERDYSTGVPSEVLKGIGPDKKGIEIYTYALLDYEKGILSIVKQQSAPSHKILGEFFTKYCSDYFLEFIPIPNKEGIKYIYEGTNPSISSLEIEVPVPEAKYLEKLFNWSEEEILDLELNKELKATIRLSPVRRQPITDKTVDVKRIIDIVKDHLNDYRGAVMRGKAEGTSTMDYNFFDAIFSYEITIEKYKVEDDEKKYLSSTELIGYYKSGLVDAYRRNRDMLSMFCIKG